MTAADEPQAQHHQRDPGTSPDRSRGTTVRIGGWLFGRRTWLPLPLALMLLLIRTGEAAPSIWLMLTGTTTVALAEALRLWGVHHIGVISRTRSDRLGPLVATGPFALVRNPLYLGNIALWVGFALSARLVWLAPLLAAALAVEYHAIVRWEEGLLESRLGEPYRAYMSSVPRWIPRIASTSPSPGTSGYSWRDTVFSERGTLIAIAVAYALLWVKLKS